MKRLALALAVLALPSCGGGNNSPTAPAPPPTTVGPSAAVIAVQQSGTGTLCLSPLAGFNFRLQVPFSVTESGGLGANFNFIRLSIFNRGAEVERREIGSSMIISALGTNRLNARGSINARLNLDFNATTFDDFSLIFNFTDDRGNVFNPTIERISPLNTANTCPS